MALADKERWNEKYEDNKIPQIPLGLISDYSSLARGKKVLDIACGMGRHSKYLASKGFEVHALDISSVAIAQLQGLANIKAEEVDFDNYILAKDAYDMIVCTYFLERKLFAQMIDALKPKGLILIETFLHHPDNERLPSNPAFRLNEGELEAFFDEQCELLHIKEYWDEDYLGYKTMKTAMVARKKSGGMNDEDFWA